MKAAETKMSLIRKAPSVRLARVRIPAEKIVDALARSSTPVFETIPQATSAAGKPVSARMRERKAFAEKVFAELSRKPRTTTALIVALGVKPGVVYRAISDLRASGRVEMTKRQWDASGVKHPKQKRRGPKAVVYKAVPA